MDIFAKLIDGSYFKVDMQLDHDIESQERFVTYVEFDRAKYDALDEDDRATVDKMIDEFEVPLSRG